MGLLNPPAGTVWVFGETGDPITLTVSFPKLCKVT
jgi:hypothetical protein